MRRMWFLTVFSAITSSAAIALFDHPRAMSLITSRSRSVRESGPELFVVSADLPQPVRHLLAQVRDVLPGLLEEHFEALGVELDRVGRGLPRSRLLAAADVVAADDPVVVALVHPAHDLRHAPDGDRMPAAELQEEPPRAVVRVGPVLVVLGLGEERVEVQAARREPGR